MSSGKKARDPDNNLIVFPPETRIKASPVGAAFMTPAKNSEVVLPRDTRYAYQLSRGIGIQANLDGAVIKNTLGSYTHLHPVASEGMFRHFVGLCRKMNKVL